MSTAVIGGLTPSFPLSVRKRTEQHGRSDEIPQRHLVAGLGTQRSGQWRWLCRHGEVRPLALALMEMSTRTTSLQRAVAHRTISCWHDIPFIPPRRQLHTFGASPRRRIGYKSYSKPPQRLSEPRAGVSPNPCVGPRGSADAQNSFRQRQLPRNREGPIVRGSVAVPGRDRRKNSPREKTGAGRGLLRLAPRPPRFLFYSSDGRIGLFLDNERGNESVLRLRRPSETDPEAFGGRCPSGPRLLVEPGAASLLATSPFARSFPKLPAHVAVPEYEGKTAKPARFLEA
jgi:hypothetical protein